MNQLLDIGDIVHTEASATPCQVEQFLGGGSQGEVYRAVWGNQHPIALKWFFPHYCGDSDPRLRERLEMAIKRGAPNEKFLWPQELVSTPGKAGFGYLMPLREPRFKGIVDLMKKRVDPSFRVLATAGFQLADSYLQLHAKGLCYRDISFGNVFFDPDTGDIRVCDNDNVDVNGVPGPINGTQRFMAPEIVRGETTPSTQTDLFSLAVLLFYMFMVHHPLEGKKEAEIHALDAAAMNRLYGSEPLFIFDPDDHSNVPVPGYHDNAIASWPIYPQFLRDLFTRAFTVGLRDPEHGRVVEAEWRSALIRLRDAIIYCPHCGRENFYDGDALKISGGQPGNCWSCQQLLRFPPRLRLENAIVMLNHDTHLYPHHLDDQRKYDFTQPLARITQHPQNPAIWGLENLGATPWTVVTANNSVQEVPPGRRVTLAPGTRIQFGTLEGEIRE